ncbi:hypothetical protein DFH08DRAFT_1025157 [Mycena albidolilacea]|uniref:DUF6534 domain-containing protein n=1 Tax=Mycena albidolilacea TaxID=1033008 RepID=A0AAD7AMB4_9AGAR|nr:hypothetical protein DFH08DRAFT_1025157 [Mycena albidolilacea]
MASPLDSTYGVWLVSLFLQTILYGIGVLQTWIYCASRPKDPGSVKWTVLVVSMLETIQIVFFFHSSYIRFVERFGELQLDLVWADPLQLLAAYLSAFVVQIYFATRIHQLTKARTKFSLSAFSIYAILLLAVVQIVAGIIQTIWSYELRSFLKLDDTKGSNTLQSAASLACDLLITTYLCLFLNTQKGEMMKTNTMMDMLIRDAINRGVLTALSSVVNMVLFLALPNTFWFFLGLAPSSKLYMNGLLTTLNTRQHLRDKLSASDKGWNSIPMATITSGDIPKKMQGRAPIAAVDFEMASDCGSLLEQQGRDLAMFLDGLITELSIPQTGGIGLIGWSMETLPTAIQERLRAWVHNVVILRASKFASAYRYLFLSLHGEPPSLALGLPSPSGQLIPHTDPAFAKWVSSYFLNGDGNLSIHNIDHLTYNDIDPALRPEVLFAMTS